MKKILIFASLASILMLLVLEIFLRKYYGFCDSLLMREDPDYEYIAYPDQTRFRFRNHISYNTFSMRSPEVDSSATVILGFGDSVINGGVHTDQNSLATTILSDTLTKMAGKKVQFLNISAGSWGPDNCFAYLKKHGNFGASSIYLFVSSHDAYDNMSFEKIVDKSPSFPSKQYRFAVLELFDRYLVPRTQKFFVKNQHVIVKKELGINKKKPSSTFNTGFGAFLAYCNQNNIPFTIYLHADKSELEHGFYNEQGKEIIQFAEDNGIKIVCDLNLGLSADEFRDGIHINAKGQRKIAERLLAVM